MAKLPYEDATSGKAALGDMQKLLQGFGAGSFGYMEDFDRGTVTVQFTWRNRRVSLEANTKGYAAAWQKRHPYGSRSRCTFAEWERKSLAQANISVYSMLRDWIKGQVTAIEVGMLSFDGAFLGQMLLQNGETVLEAVERGGVLPLPAPAPVPRS